jgi:hypothetical protein
VNPSLQGYTAAVAETAGPAALGGLTADLEAIEQLVLSSPQLRAALTDTAVAGPARRAVMLDLLEGKVSPAARRLAAFACMAVEAPEVPSALGWVSTRVRHLGEGQDEEPGLSLPASGSVATPPRCTRTCPPTSWSRSRTTSSASPA